MFWTILWKFGTIWLKKNVLKNWHFFFLKIDFWTILEDTIKNEVFPTSKCHKMAKNNFFIKKVFSHLCYVFLSNQKNFQTSTTSGSAALRKNMRPLPLHFGIWFFKWRKSSQSMAFYRQEKRENIFLFTTHLQCFKERKQKKLVLPAWVFFSIDLNANHESKLENTQHLQRKDIPQEPPQRWLTQPWKTNTTILILKQNNFSPWLWWGRSKIGLD